MSHSAFGSNPLPGFSRRGFLKAAGAAAMLPATSRWAEGRPPASDRITLGVIGWGGIGPANTKAFLAICRLPGGGRVRPGRQSSAGCRRDGSTRTTGTRIASAYHDYRELLARDDIDAVMIAVPDHWHAHRGHRGRAGARKTSTAKSLWPAPSPSSRRSCAPSRRTTSSGRWARGSAPFPIFHKAAEIVRNGLIGDVTRVEVGLPGGNSRLSHDAAAGRAAPSWHCPGQKLPSPQQIVPGTPAWDLPSPILRRISTTRPGLARRRWSRTSTARFQNWRWNYNTGGGQLMDWIGHHGDIAHWGLGFDATGPSEVEGHGEFPPANAIWNTATKYTIECNYRKEVTGYPVDVAMTIAGGYPAIMRGRSGSARRLGVGGSQRSSMRRIRIGCRWSLAGRPAQDQAVRVGRAPAQLPGLREVAQADDHAGADGAPLDDSGPPGADFDAGGAEDLLGPGGGDYLNDGWRGTCCRGRIGGRIGCWGETASQASDG